MANIEQNYPIDTNRSIDAWTERLVRAGICASWLSVAAILYGLVRLVSRFL